MVARRRSCREDGQGTDAQPLRFVANAVALRGRRRAKEIAVVAVGPRTASANARATLGADG
jgi:hypothetical protein